MIEAVNSALAAGTAVKGAQESVSPARSYAANPGKVQEAAIAPYLSTKIRMDNDFDKAVLEFRSTETGDVLSQTPSKQQLQAYRKSTTDATIDVADARGAQTAPADTAPTPDNTDTTTAV